MWRSHVPKADRRDRTPHQQPLTTTPVTLLATRQSWRILLINSYFRGGWHLLLAGTCYWLLLACYCCYKEKNEKNLQKNLPTG